MQRKGTLLLRLEELKNQHLLPRKYSPRMIKDIFEKVLCIERSTAIMKTNRELIRNVQPQDNNVNEPKNTSCCQHCELRQKLERLNTKSKEIKIVKPLMVYIIGAVRKKMY